MKPRFLIKSGYYIVPSPSTALVFSFCAKNNQFSQTITCSNDHPHSSKSLHMLARVTFYLSILIPKFLCRYCYTHEDGLVLGYPTQDCQRKIPLSTISNDISSIVLPLIFYHYFSTILILISKLKSALRPNSF